ncbi:L,D-transpeptidase family protein [Microbacterium horticulturae]|uniref:L,D-transpeptidase family protein n=1 Tax=Microbacterium horticulturae TaxID=3028316 RepID=A0ABY8BV58_9MICO|nr:L,D-transpeptidase family protein [Microbacterium sp. KACC 23027]WEG08054.1 L,D-transpeptidase family protein [Microbacterium sp. KACC 23027]
MADQSQKSGADGTSSQSVAWAPAPPHKRKRHLGLWIGTPIGVALAGVVAASLILIAPGTAVAGVQIGGMTPGSAAAAIQKELENTTVELSGDGIDATLTGAQLGATVDASSLASAAYSEHPMWKIGSWYSETKQARVTLDHDTAEAALRKAAPALFEDPVDAAVAYDADSEKYVVTDAEKGTGIDLDAVASALQTAFDAGQTRASVEATTIATDPAISTETAKTTARTLNKVLDTAGFYVGKERTVPVDRKVAASWLTVTPRDGSFDVTADASAIDKVVSTLAKKVDRAPQNGTVITNSSGTVLATEKETLDGRTLGDTSGIAAAFATQLASGDGTYELKVSVDKASTTKISRYAVVDLSEQRAYFYQNGKLWNSYLVSTGRAGHATPTGHFAVFAHVGMQDMGCVDGYDYCTKNVPWVTYFAPDIAFHGTYWHNNFGHVMSHGCVNMPISIAKTVYDWAPDGMEVTVQP